MARGFGQRGKRGGSRWRRQRRRLERLGRYEAADQRNQSDKSGRSNAVEEPVAKARAQEPRRGLRRDALVDLTLRETSAFKTRQRRIDPMRKSRFAEASPRQRLAFAQNRRIEPRDAVGARAVGDKGSGRGADVRV